MEYSDSDILEYRNALGLFEDLETNLGELVNIKYISICRDLNRGIREEEGHIFQINRFIDMDTIPTDYYEGQTYGVYSCSDGKTYLRRVMKYSFSGSKMILSITNMDGKDLYYNPFLDSKIDSNGKLDHLLSHEEITEINKQMFGDIVGDILDEADYQTKTEEVMQELEQKLPNINPRPTGRRKILE